MAKQKVNVHYIKRFDFQVEMEDAEIANILEHGEPKWVKEVAREMDPNTEPEFDYWEYTEDVDKA